MKDNKTYDLSWLSSDSLKGSPFKEIKINNASRLNETLEKEFAYYSN